MTFFTLVLIGCKPPPEGACRASATRITCDHETALLSDGNQEREVHWQVPLGTPPSAGWPVALFFQGSLFSAEGLWSAVRGSPLGQYHQADVTRTLLEAGYAVIGPETVGNGHTAWHTNLPQWADNWDASPDAALIDEIFAAAGDGRLGGSTLSEDDWSALGISSGGYMTSRMAVSLPGQFRSLVIVSGSYATCGGVVCDVPEVLPADHPPTRFVHGALDLVVPPYTMRKYETALAAQGTETDVVMGSLVAHAWFDDAPGAVLDWFDRHP